MKIAKLIIKFQHPLNVLGAREADFALHLGGALRSVYGIAQNRDFNRGFSGAADLGTLIKVHVWSFLFKIINKSVPLFGRNFV
jgi:hypothetical protein